jgi:type IX secretion system PorP/SprF family membrane protein
MERILIAFGLLCSMVSTTYAQQEGQYTQFMYNKTLINAGYTGARRVHSVYAIYRNQWMGFNGNPQSYLVSYDGPIGKKLGVGLNLVNQELGVTKNQFANMMLSYGIIQTEQMSLRMGINTAIRRYAFSLTDPNVYIQDPQDASLRTSDQTVKNYFNVGAGAYFDFKNFYVGLSIPNLNKNLISVGFNPNATTQAQEKQHIYLMTGGLFKIKEDVEFKPSVLFKYVKNAPFSLDMNLSAVFKRRFTVGGSYRYGESGGKGDSIDALAFFQVSDKLGIGAAYDFTISGLRRLTTGTIEAMIRYDFTPSISNQVLKKSKDDIDPNRLSNPRFFF